MGKGLLNTNNTRCFKSNLKAPFVLVWALAFHLVLNTNLYAQELDLTELKDYGTILDSIALADSLAAEAQVSSKDTLEYQAKELGFDNQSKTFNLFGEATLEYQGATLDGDTIAYNLDKQTVMASGKPTLQDKTNPAIHGKRMKYNFKKKVGQIFYGSSWRTKEQFNGTDISRLPDGRLLIARGDFTTCDETDESSFYFYSRRMVIEPEKSVTARPVVLNVAEVPIAILPLLIHPLESERRSGLLTPKYGGDQSKGFYLENFGFYWATNDYMDWTNSGDLIEGEKGTFNESALHSKFRYKENYKLDGNIDGDYYIQDFGSSEQKWDLHFNHNQILSPDGRATLKGSGSFVSSTDVRQNNAISRETVLDQQANAELTYRQQFRNQGVLSLNLKQDENLNYITSDEFSNPTRRVTRELPDIQYRISGPLIPFESSPLDTTSEAEWFNKFQYSLGLRGKHLQKIYEDSVLQVNADTSWVGANQSFDLSYNGGLGDYLTLTPSISQTGNWTAKKRIYPGTDSSYAYNDFEPGQNNYGNVWSRYKLSVASGTKFFGFWLPEWGRFTGIMHTVSPGISYTYSPEFDSIPEYDLVPGLHGSTYQAKEKTIGYSLKNDWDLKYVKETITQSEGDSIGKTQNTYGYLRFLSLESSTSYNFEAPDSSKWSLINSTISVQPFEDYRFSFNTTHSFYDRYRETLAQRSIERVPILMSYNFSLSRDMRIGGKFSSGQILTGTNRPLMTPWSANLSYNYRYSASRISKSIFRRDITHSANGGIQLQPTENWKMGYNTHYDFKNGKFAEHHFNFERIIGCWEMVFDWYPVGPTQGWSFVIRIIELPDIQFNSSDQKYRQ